MAKAQRLEPLASSCKTTRKNKKKKKQLGVNFSDSEIDAAEQLIQLSGDSDSTHANNHHEEISDVSVANSNYNKHFFNESNSRDNDDDDDDAEGDRTLSGSGPIRRKKKIKRIKSLFEIYGLTKPPPIVKCSSVN